MDHDESERKDKRKNTRSEFAFPVRFNIYMKDIVSKPFNGEICNISLGGICIRFEDRYGRVDPEHLRDVRVRVRIKVPQGEPVSFNNVVVWSRRENPKKGFFLLAGLKFMDVTDWQLEQIEQFINLRNKDHKMIWNLIDQYL